MTGLRRKLFQEYASITKQFFNLSAKCNCKEGLFFIAYVYSGNQSNVKVLRRLSQQVFTWCFSHNNGKIHQENSCWPDHQDLYTNSSYILIRFLKDRDYENMHLVFKTMKAPQRMAPCGLKGIERISPSPNEAHNMGKTNR